MQYFYSLVHTGIAQNSVCTYDQVTRGRRRGCTQFNLLAGLWKKASEQIVGRFTESCLETMNQRWTKASTDALVLRSRKQRCFRAACIRIYRDANGTSKRHFKNIVWLPVAPWEGAKRRFALMRRESVGASVAVYVCVCARAAVLARSYQIQWERDSSTDSPKSPSSAEGRLGR